MELDSPDETLQTRKQAAPRPDDPTMRVRTVRYDRERSTPADSTAKVTRVRGARAGGWGLVIALVIALCAAGTAWMLLRRSESSPPAGAAR